MFITLIFSIGLGLGSLQSTPAWAHGDHGDEPFAATFDEIRQMKFMVREPDPSAEVAYIRLPDGTRVPLDERFQSAARRLAGRFYDHEPVASVGPRRMRDYVKTYGRFAAAKLDYFFSRKFVLELAGTGVEAFYRFGLVPAVVLIATEIVDHSPINFLAVPLCPIIYGTWEFCSMQSQEAARILRHAHPSGGGLRDRLRAWKESKKWRFKIWRGTKLVTAGDSEVDLNHQARLFTMNDKEPGMDALYGGLIKPGFYRNAFARPIMNFTGGASANPREHAPVFFDFPTGAGLGERVLWAEQYGEYLNDLMKLAQTATTDLVRVKELVGGITRGVSLKDTWARAAGFLGLRRDLARMRRATDLYVHALQVRATHPRARTAVEADIDAEYAASLGEFFEGFSHRIAEVDTMTYGKLAPGAAVREKPRALAELLRAWVYGGESCAAALMAVPQT